MYRLVKANKRMTFGEENPVIVIKGDYIPHVSTEGENFRVMVHRVNYDRPKEEFTEDGEVPETVTRFSHEKVQQFVKLIKIAQDKGYKTVDSTWGNIHPTHNESSDIVSSFEDTYAENTEKTLLWISKHDQEELSPTIKYEREGKPIISVYNQFQVVGVDFNEVLDTEFADKFMELLSELKELTEEEKREIQYAKLVREWNKVLKSKVRNIEDNRRRALRTLEDSRKAIVSATQDVRFYNHELSNVEVLLKQDAEELIEKAKEVDDLPFVKQVYHEDTAMVVEFNDFHHDFNYQGNVFRFPYKDVKVKLYPTKVEFSHNKPYTTSSGEVYYHMHSSGEGRSQSVCFGDHSERVSLALAQRKFREVIFTVKTLLGSHNQGDTLSSFESFMEGTGIGKWTDSGDFVPVKEVEVQSKLVEDVL